jgi:ADP-heptose:LPS heptosyltransferase
LWKSAVLPFLAGVKCRIGFSSATAREWGVSLLYTDRVRATARHIVDQNGELSVRAGAKSPVADVVLGIRAEDEAAVREFLQARGIDRYVVLSPGGGWRSKCWPTERFRALSRRIQESLSLPCVVNYGQGEEDLAGETSSEAPGACVTYSGRLGQLMALLRRATCIVAGDTGPLHLAVALGTPAVALFGPTDPGRNGPYRMTPSVRGNDIVLRAPSIVTTHARHTDTHPAMLALPVDVVFEAVRRSIGAAS